MREFEIGEQAGARLSALLTAPCKGFIEVERDTEVAAALDPHATNRENVRR